jgi:hypothetical protein
MAITSYSELKTATERWLGRDELTNRIPEWIAMAEDRIAQDLRVQAMETHQVIKWNDVTDGGTVGGTANAITLSGLSTPALGDTVSFTAALTNTSTVTLNTTYAMKRRHGGVKEGLSSGDIVLGQNVRGYYDGTDFILAPQGGALLPSNFLQLRRSYLDISSGKRLNFFDPSVFWERNVADDSGQMSAFTIEGDFLVAAPVPDGSTYARLLYYRRFTALSSDSDTNWILTNARGLYLYGALLEAYTFLEDDAGQLKYAAMYEDELARAHAADRKSRFPMGALASRSQVSVV